MTPLNIKNIYSLTTGLNHTEGKIWEEFIPCDIDLGKTILIGNHYDDSAPSRHYDYFSLVADFLVPLLAPMGYNLAQLSNKANPRINSCHRHFLVTTIPQSSYLIKNCALLITADSAYAKIAGVYDKKVVTLFGPTSPCVNQNKNTIQIGPLTKSPTYKAHESPKSINLIPPEMVLDKVCKLIGINPLGLKTLHTGTNYNDSVIEVIPDEIISPKLFPNVIFNIRMDYQFDEAALAQILPYRKYNVIADRPIDLEIFRKNKGNVNLFNFELKRDTFDFEYCKGVKQAGVKTIFFTREKDENLNYLRLKMLDLALVETLEESKNPLDKEEGNPLDLSSVKFKTNKFLLSSGKVYLSHQHWKNGIATPSFLQNQGRAIDSEDFWKDSNFYYLFRD